ncbi:MAG: LacI family DNA-binding transcriptional regulator [Bacilli bacterium]|nr:LacI family DNA-binding transcriptional regulator [Bacilli bacterium]
MKITIREIAKEANVSVATVSRCINNKGYVHEETKR